jgi:hypothetical protein
VTAHRNKGRAIADRRLRHYDLPPISDGGTAGCESIVRDPRGARWQVVPACLEFGRCAAMPVRVVAFLMDRIDRSDQRLSMERRMSSFGKIVSAIFGTKAGAASGAAPASTSATATPSSGTAPASAQTVDVAAVLDKAVAAQKEKLEWRTSIVDLMKALNLDSSLAARKELAKELNYTGDTNDSATMNIWLHKQVIRKLAENGGKVPDDLKT